MASRHKINIDAFWCFRSASSTSQYGLRPHLPLSAARCWPNGLMTEGAAADDSPETERGHKHPKFQSMIVHDLNEGLFTL